MIIKDEVLEYQYTPEMGDVIEFAPATLFNPDGGITQKECDHDH